MKNNRVTFVASLLFLGAFIASCSKDGSNLNQSGLNNSSALSGQSLVKKSPVNATVTNFGTTIAYPRGLKFGPDGDLYVALAGWGGTTTTTCTQVVAPLGPYMGGNTGKIVKISPEGVVSTVAEHLPSSINQQHAILGPADVEFIGNDLYALLDAGCSHGNPDYPSSVIKVNPNGTWSVVADLSAYYATHPVAKPEADDFEPDGTPYSMVNVRGDFYVVEPNHGELLKVTTGGMVTRVLDFSAVYGHIVPTAVAYRGNFFVGNLTTFPLVQGAANIYKVTPDGSVEVWQSGFTGVLGVAFDARNRMYVLETSQGNGPIPGTGRVIRVNSDDSRDVIVDHLNFPTGMTFGPDGALYISSWGFGPPTGQILKVVF